MTIGHSTVRLRPDTTDLGRMAASLSRMARRAGLTALVAMLWLPAAAQAQAAFRTSGQPRSSAPPISLDELRTLVDEQRALISAQAARLDAQGRELADLRRRVDDVSTVALGASHAVAELKPQAGAPTTAAIEQRPAAIEQSPERAPEMPTAAVSAGEFPGSIRVPGTDTAMKSAARHA